MRTVVDALMAAAVPLSVDDIAAHFTARGPLKRRLPYLMDMLLALGSAQVRDGRYFNAQ